MTTTQAEALNRAQSGKSIANDYKIIQGFAEMGVPLDDIKPRENIFTFNAWKAQGRIVRKGMHGVKITVFIEKKETKEIFPRTVTVFHYEQTQSLSHE